MCSWISSDFSERMKLVSLLDYMSAGKVDEFSDRNYNQKLVYILSELGIDGIYNYRFNWRDSMGPYSSDLGDDIFEARPFLKLMKEGEIDSKIAEDDLKIISKFNSIIGDLQQVDESVGKDGIEILSSLAYLKKMVPDQEMRDTKKIVFDFVLKTRSKLKETDLEKYWNVVEKYKLGNAAN
ncbi:MAG: hypothetical protein KJ906_00840 [Nanoarchaeota archaeon]|nr:hypothetical protein [Nanoarchaeota archaeon]